MNGQMIQSLALGPESEEELELDNAQEIQCLANLVRIIHSDTEKSLNISILNT